MKKTEQENLLSLKVMQSRDLLRLVVTFCGLAERAALINTAPMIRAILLEQKTSQSHSDWDNVEFALGQDKFLQAYIKTAASLQFLEVKGRVSRSRDIMRDYERLGDQLRNMESTGYNIRYDRSAIRRRMMRHFRYYNNFNFKITRDELYMLFDVTLGFVRIQHPGSPLQYSMCNLYFKHANEAIRKSRKRGLCHFFTLRLLIGPITICLLMELLKGYTPRLIRFIQVICTLVFALSLPIFLQRSERYSRIEPDPETRDRLAPPPLLNFEAASSREQDEAIDMCGSLVRHGINSYNYSYYSESDDDASEDDDQEITASSTAIR